MNRIAKAEVANTVNENLAMPLYHQVYLVMRENIRNGAYSADRMVPTETELCDSFGVSRITIKRAMRMLAEDGLVTRQRGRGTFIADQLPAPPRRNALDDLLQTVQNIGASTEVRRVGGGPVAASIEVAEKLRCAQGDQVYLIKQLRSSKREPIALVHAYLPIEISARLGERNQVSLPVLAQLQRAGVPIDRADQTMSATLADPSTAELLGVNVGAPLMRITRIVYDDAQNPVEWVVALYRGDRYEILTTLSRDGLSGQLRAPIIPSRRAQNQRAAQ
ncbi:MAG: GntR family transcriptional regulator [Rhodobacteraceae bacterium]|nr:GntR family transcriptional regulator [Paracoccaceae bacterium]